MQTASPDISVLEYEVLFDISIAAPSIKIKNHSTIEHPEELKWVFEVVSPTGIPIYKGNFDTPDASGDFTDFTIPAQIPLMFGQIEFSNINEYKVIVNVKDSAGNIYTLPKGKALCKPNGNGNSNNFGAAILNVEPKCQQARLYVKDESILTYKGVTGNLVETVAKLNYPLNNDGSPRVITVTALPALFPINEEGEGYDLYAYHVIDYDLGDLFFVRIRYSFRRSFPIWCNVDLCPLLTDIERLTLMVEGNCDSQEKIEQSKKLAIINAKLLKVISGILQPLCGFDVPKIIQEIKELGGFTCNCFSPRGVSQNTNFVSAEGNFTATPLCGEATMFWTQDEHGNYNLSYKNKLYKFSICGQDDINEDAARAFKFQTLNTECTTEVCLKVDVEILSNEVLASIKDNDYLIAIFNSIVKQNEQIKCSSLDGKGIVDTTKCTYSVQIKIGGLTKKATQILINGVQYAIGSILLTDTVGLANFLNSLNKGTFAVTYDSENDIVQILSANNTNKVSNISVLKTQGSKGNSTDVHSFTSSCGSICDILQTVINYLAGLNSKQVKLGQKMTVCAYDADPIGFIEDDWLSNFLTEINKTVCRVVKLLTDEQLKEVVIKNSFPTPSVVPTPKVNDGVMVVIDGHPLTIPLKKFAIGLFGLLCSDVDVKNAYCQCAACNSNSCSPVTNLTGVIGSKGAAFTWDAVIGATKYMVSKDGGVTWLPVSGTSYNVTGLTPETSYTFKVFPVYNSGNGDACTVSYDYTTIAEIVCQAPTNVEAVQSNDNIILSWDAVVGATYQWQINGGAWNNSSANIVSIAGVTPGSLNNYTVRLVIGGIPCGEQTTVQRALLGNLKYKVNGETNGFSTTIDLTPNVTTQTNWGDGTIDSNKTHTYLSKGIYTIEVEIQNPLAITDIELEGSVREVVHIYNMPNAVNLILNNNSLISFQPDAIPELTNIEIRNNGLNATLVTNIFHDIYTLLPHSSAVTVDLTNNAIPSDLTEITAANLGGWTVLHD